MTTTYILKARHIDNISGMKVFAPSCDPAAFAIYVASNQGFPSMPYDFQRFIEGIRVGRHIDYRSGQSQSTNTNRKIFAVANEVFWSGFHVASGGIGNFTSNPGSGMVGRYIDNISGMKVFAVAPLSGIWSYY